MEATYYRHTAFYDVRCHQMAPNCFVYGCNHQYGRDLCTRFRFPTDSRKSLQWEKLCRRADRRLNVGMDRICSCHFKDGRKENGPTIFPWNANKLFDFPDPEQTTRKRLRITYEATTHMEPEAVNIQEEAGQTQPHHDHTYALDCKLSCLQQKELLNNEISNLTQKVEALELDLRHVRQTLQEEKDTKKNKMAVSDIKDNAELMLLYTSLEYDIFDILVGTLQRFEISYYFGWKVTSLSLEDQLLITLMKLRLNLRDRDLGFRFGVSRTTISNIFHTLVKALHEIFFCGLLGHNLPSQLKCKGSMPASFADFISARLVLDATEVTQDVPREFNKQAACYSNYKSRHTVKAVTGVAPNGALVFCSELYPGSTSDVSICRHSGVLQQLEAGDLILADKGFTVHDQVPHGVSVNIPPFLIGKKHFSKQEAQMCAKIARARIHVERANERIKNFEILHHIPAAYRAIATEILQLCCCLVNMQAPLLKEIAQKYED